MHAVRSRQGLGLAVLREQGHGRHLLAGKHVLQVFDQGEARALDHLSRIVAAQFGPLNEALHGGFHGPQHQRRRSHAHHFERAAGLVQLLACDAQRTRIQRSQVGFPGDLRVTHEPAHGLDGPVQGFAQLVEHPREGSEVLLTLGPVGTRSVCGIDR